MYDLTYGMNFENRRELCNPYSHFVTLGNVATFAIGLYMYFYRSTGSSVKGR